REHFKYNLWMKAFEETGIDPNFYTYRQRTYDEILAWDIIDAGVTKEFLKNENSKALEGIQSVDCRQYCIGCGINEKVKCTREGTL
ncbi:MAG: B12-binding domain-containing radical SAM protein, partial [Bacillota bacterium]